MGYSYKPIENKFVKSNIFNITNNRYFVYIFYDLLFLSKDA